jgi:hypothetical protein
MRGFCHSHKHGKMQERIPYPTDEERSKKDSEIGVLGEVLGEVLGWVRARFLFSPCLLDRVAFSTPALRGGTVADGVRSRGARE